MNNLSISGATYQPSSLKALVQAENKEDSSFGQVMKNAITNVDGMGKQADTAIVDMLQGMPMFRQR